MDEKILLQVLDSVNNNIDKIDIINKRLVTCIIIISISFSVCVSAIVASYFFSDYDYATMEQVTTIEEVNSNQKINK